MVFKSSPATDGRRALLTAAALIGVNLLIALLTLALPVGGFTFILLLLFLLLWLPIAYVLWRAWASLSLAYWVDRNALTLAWGPVRQVIPLTNIQAIRRGAAVEALISGVQLAAGPNGQVDEPARLLAERWATLKRFVIFGPDLGTRRMLQNRKVYSVASQPLPNQLVLDTTGGVYGISPADPDAFLAALEEHHRLGPTHLVQQARHWPTIMRWPLWQDWLLLALLVLGIPGILLLLSIALNRFPSLPFALPQWNGLDRRAIFLFPAFGLAVWLINGLWGLIVYERQRMAAALLWGGALAAQAVALLALLTMTRG